MICSKRFLSALIRSSFFSLVAPFCSSAPLDSPSKTLLANNVDHKAARGSLPLFGSFPARAAPPTSRGKIDLIDEGVGGLGWLPPSLNQSIPIRLTRNRRAHHVAPGIVEQKTTLSPPFAKPYYYLASGLVVGTHTPSLTKILIIT